MATASISRSRSRKAGSSSQATANRHTIAQTLQAASGDRLVVEYLPDDCLPSDVTRRTLGRVFRIKWDPEAFNDGSGDNVASLWREYSDTNGNVRTQIVADLLLLAAQLATIADALDSDLVGNLVDGLSRSKGGAA